MKIIYNSKEVDIPENTPVGEAFRSEIENSKFPIIDLMKKEFCLG